MVPAGRTVDDIGYHLSPLRSPEPSGRDGRDVRPAHLLAPTTAATSAAMVRMLSEMRWGDRPYPRAL